MVRDLDISVDVVDVPTVRDEMGIAISSRNMLLSPDELHVARCLAEALAAASTRWDSGERDAASLREAIEMVIRDEARAKLDYASVADVETLREYSGRVTGPVIVSLAVYIGGVRLIDNTLLGAS